MCIDPPWNERSLVKEEVEHLSLNDYQNLRLYGLLATGPKKKETWKRASSEHNQFQRLVKKVKMFFGSTQDDMNRLLRMTGKYPNAQKKAMTFNKLIHHIAAGEKELFYKKRIERLS